MHVCCFALDTFPWSDGHTPHTLTEVATIARETEERMKALCAFIDKLGSINDALAIQQLEVGNHNPYEA